MTEPRDYQLDMLSRLEEAWTRYRSVMVQMPTGTGKTILLTQEIKNEEAIIRGSGSGGVLVVAHRHELIEQIKESIKSLGIDSSHVRVESIQKLSRHIDEIDFNPSLIVVDEAHHALARTYRLLWSKWPKAKFLGLTATPCRLNGSAFTDLFDVLLQSWTIQEFISKGWLSDFEYISAAPDSEALKMVASLHKRGTDGDYQTKEMATVMDVPESIEHLYQTYRQFANGKKGIVYAIDRQHARHIAEYYKSKGVNCAVIDAKTPATERQRIIEAYKTHPHPLPVGRGVDSTSLDVLVNVDIFSEGFDCPEVEFIQLARPTLSLSKYLQQVGRGMRISAGKEAVLILDMVGLYHIFGLPTEERDWQKAFLGRMVGKGQPGTAHPVVIKDDAKEEKTLVNLQMVRICRSSESLEGLNVYLQDGKYGVMKDGRATTKPVFERVEKYNNGQFFALATYPFAFYKNRTTVIDLQGLDQMVQLYGHINQHGDFLYGEDSRGEKILWDTIGRKYYKGKEPTFERLGAFDIVKSRLNEHLTTQYELRYSKGTQGFYFSKGEVLFNNHIAIIRNLLIVKRNGYHIYNIFGYMGDSVLVSTRRGFESLQVKWNGKIGKLFDYIPATFSLSPDSHSLKLKQAK